jgi:hypothetical protein
MTTAIDIFSSLIELREGGAKSRRRRKHDNATAPQNVLCSACRAVAPPDHGGTRRPGGYYPSR